MRILHVIPGLRNSSGPTQSVYFLSKYQTKAGHKVAIAFISGRGMDPEFDFYPGVELMGFPYKYFRSWGYSPALKDYLLKHGAEYDIVHVHMLWLYPNLAVYLAARKTSTPYIIRPAGSLEPWAFNHKKIKKQFYLWLIERRIIDGASAIHVTAKQEEENLRPFGFKPPIIKIPNGIELSTYGRSTDVQGIGKELQIPDDKFILLYISRIHPKKNLEFLGRVFKILIEKREDVFLLIAGPKNHDYGEKIQQYYDNLGLKDHSRFIGEVSGAEKVDLYHKANAFILTTFSENFGFVVLEALATGLPVLVSDQTPWDELNKKRAGYWLPLDEQVFVKSIITLVEDKGLRKDYSKAALKIANRFDWSFICGKLDQEYSKIIKR